MHGIIEAKQLSTGYGKKIILKDQNIVIPENKITVILGPNGCGKSTMLKTMARVLPLKDGKIILDGKDLKTMKTAEIAQKLGFLSQILSTPEGISVYELVSYGRYPYKKISSAKENQKIIEWALKETQTFEIKDMLVYNLSGGQKQRVWIAMILAQQTNIILLDEPTTYLDIGHQLEVLELLSKLNKEEQQTIVMVLHDINHASRYSDWIIAMKEGKVFKEGTPKEIITPEVIQELYGVKTQVVFDKEHNCPVCFSYDL
ncbi:ABC transporter ATP-binding protein [Thomasclavelia sp.]